MNQSLQCPNCKAKLTIPTMAKRVSGKCPRCQHPIELADPAPHVASDTTPPPVLQSRTLGRISQQLLESPTPPSEARSTQSSASTRLAREEQTRPSPKHGFNADDDNMAALIARVMLKRGVRGTNVNPCLSAILGLAMTGAFYTLALPLHSTFFGALLFHRGLVPYFIMYLSFWSLAILMLKSINVRKQRKSFGLQILPAEIDATITPDNADAFQKHILSVARDTDHSFLVSRVSRALNHFRTRRSVQEVVTYLQTQSEIDAHAVFSSYRLVKVCIWAIPILGFVGTVVGIGSAVGGFSATINGAGELEAIKDSLGGVTTGLALAFDTTLLALVMSMVVMFPMSYFQKQEEDLLNRIDDYCNEHLSRRLDDLANGENSNDHLVAVLDRMLIRHQSHWLGMCEQMAQKIGDRINTAWDSVQKCSLESNRQLVVAVQKAIDDSARQGLAITNRMHQLQQRQTETIGSSLEHASKVASTVLLSLEHVGTECDRTRNDLSALLQQQSSFVEAASSQLSSFSQSSSDLSECLDQASKRIAGAEWFGLRNELNEKLEAAITCTPNLMHAIDQLNVHLNQPPSPVHIRAFGLIPGFLRRKPVLS